MQNRINPSVAALSEAMTQKIEKIVGKLTLSNLKNKIRVPARASAPIFGAILLCLVAHEVAHAQGGGPIFSGSANNLANIIREGIKLFAILLFCGGALGVGAAIWNKMWGKDWANYAIGGGAAFAFGTIIAVIYAIAQGQNVAIDTNFKHMRPRPVRPNVYDEIKRCGVYQGDWKYILIPTALAYILPFVCGWWIYYIPVGVPLGAMVFILTLSLFTLVRAGKPKCWLLHKLDAASDGWSKYRKPLADEYERESWITTENS